MTPFFSIIIPLYNSGNTLITCLDSIISQTYKNYELVLIDGASSDNTLQLINNFRSLHNDMSIQLLSEPDGGIYEAMNKGIDLAKGDWLYFMGSDDSFYSPDVLNQVSTDIENESVDLVYGNVEGVDSHTRYVYDTIDKVLSQGIHHQSVFYKKQLFNTIGKYDIGFKVAADYHFTLKVFFNNSFKTKYTDIDIAHYGETGLSSTTYDYKFFSYHYKFLVMNNGIDKIDNKQKCLDTSIYCCLYLARQKKDLGFAWRNLLFYITASNGLSLKFRIKTFLRMVYWGLKPSA
ncbi:glycosyltransferase family 2 protein [Mucilaginibacter pocheonensis]|uniref:Glycosyltransferase involved in cell wall biosynthesis n=1 Tax=Mucilaginibacter pocheonensis TaxID=398050 RepID=A0ABU1T6B9_9SPHI|nr:glycosyltransferase family 2 protein [Mucilaginibacter pocheonensis]MDR6940410.1 glycosyltransferase involved in cell wall biosynthesis [Mucilaginibacter pocheonensis]